MEHPRPVRRRSKRTTLRLIALAIGVSIVGVVASLFAAPRESVENSLDVAHLPNAHRLHDRVLFGGAPNGMEGFRELHALGVRTVISVDGMSPDVSAATRFGIRYVHLPHGYDGVPERRAMELAKAVRELPGPLYIHCHHGKHRSPAAAAVACIRAGLVAPERARSILQTAGTSYSYRGLYESAEAARPADLAELDELEVDFRPTVPVPPLAQAMVAMERLHDRLQLSASAGWQTPAQHPALEPAHEALLLTEQFREGTRTYVSHSDPAFGDWLRESEKAGEQLQAALRAPRDLAAAHQHLAAITHRCQTCHAKFRDVPLREKQ